MKIEQVRSALTSKIHPIISTVDENQLASVLIVIYGQNPFIIMTEKSRNLKQTPLSQCKGENHEPNNYT